MRHSFSPPGFKTTLTGVPISIVSTVVCSVSAEAAALFASWTPSWIWLKMSVRTITR